LNPLHKYILQLLLLNILLIVTGSLLIPLFLNKLVLFDLAVLSSIFTIIAIIGLSVFLHGQTKEPDSQTLLSLVSVSLKFLLELAIALLWFIVAKKTSLTSVLLFFVLYLTFTLFSIWVILKTLKNKSL